MPTDRQRTDAETERELYELASYARLNGLDLALKWLMREVAIANRRPRARKKIRVRLPGGGEFFMDRERLRED